MPVNTQRWRWRPSLMVSIALTLLISPLAFFYLNRARWAAAYVALSVTLIPIWLYTGVWLLLALMIVMLLHAVWLQRRYDPSRLRAWTSRPFGLVFIAVAGLTALLAIRLFVLEPFRIPSASMRPYLQNGDFILVDKLGFGTRQTMGWKLAESRPPAASLLRRGSVYVFQHPRTGVTFVKRLMALPGDSLEMRDQQLWLNDKRVNLQFLSDDDRHQLFLEGPLSATTQSTAELASGYQSYQSYQIRRSIDRPVTRPVQITLADNQYYFMGDNRDHSVDSRMYGVVPGENIIGRVIVVLRPLFDRG